MESTVNSVLFGKFNVASFDARVQTECWQRATHAIREMRMLVGL
jgi:hypothetical protein